jgi:hypothetical protein
MGRTLTEPAIPTTTRYLEFFFPEAAPQPSPAGHPPMGVMASTESVSKPKPPEQFDSWNDVINWCRSYSDSKAAFVVDGQGFVLSTAGQVPPDRFEGTGAELCFSMSQVERVAPEEGPLRYLEAGFKQSKIMGIKLVADDSANEFVLGLVSPGALLSEEKQQLADTALKNIALLV